MEKLIEAQKAKSATVRPFTAESLEKIKQRIDAEKQRAEEEAQKSKDAEADAKTAGSRARRTAAAAAAEKKKKAAATSTRDYPNPALESGKKFPDKLGEFPRELYGQPIEDLDDFYNNKYVSAALCSRSLPRSINYYYYYYYY